MKSSVGPSFILIASLLAGFSACKTQGLPAASDSTDSDTTAVTLVDASAVTPVTTGYRAAIQDGLSGDTGTSTSISNSIDTACTIGTAQGAPALIIKMPVYSQFPPTTPTVLVGGVSKPNTRGLYITVPGVTTGQYVFDSDTDQAGFVWFYRGFSATAGVSFSSNAVLPGDTDNDSDCEVDLTVAGGIANGTFLCTAIPRFNWSTSWAADPSDQSASVVGGSFSCKIGP